MSPCHTTVTSSAVHKSPDHACLGPNSGSDQNIPSFGAGTTSSGQHRADAHGGRRKSSSQELCFPRLFSPSSTVLQLT